MHINYDSDEDVNKIQEILQDYHERRKEFAESIIRRTLIHEWWEEDDDDV